MKNLITIALLFIAQLSFGQVKDSKGNVFPVRPNEKYTILDDTLFTDIDYRYHNGKEWIFVPLDTIVKKWSRDSTKSHPINDFWFDGIRYNVITYDTVQAMGITFEWYSNKVETFPLLLIYEVQGGWKTEKPQKIYERIHFHTFHVGTGYEGWVIQDFYEMLERKWEDYDSIIIKRKKRE